MTFFKTFLLIGKIQLFYPQILSMMIVSSTFSIQRTLMIFVVLNVERQCLSLSPSYCLLILNDCCKWLISGVFIISITITWLNFSNLLYWLSLKCTCEDWFVISSNIFSIFFYLLQVDIRCKERQTKNFFCLKFYLWFCLWHK